MTDGIEYAFKFCPHCGLENPAPGAIPFRCESCGFAQFFGPVAAVGALVVNEKNQLLLVRRARNPGKGLWGLPGGFVDRGETVEGALKREVYEETKLRLAKTEMLVTYPNEYRYCGYVSPVIDFFYVCTVSQPFEVELEPEELDDFQWTIPTQAQLENMAFVSNRRAIEKWLSDTGIATVG